MTGSPTYLQTPLQFLKGVGPRKAADFARAGLHTDRRSPVSFSAAIRRPQPTAVDRVAPRGADRLDRAARSSRAACAAPGVPASRIFEALLRDAAGTLRLAWFNSALSQGPDPARHCD